MSLSVSSGVDGDQSKGASKQQVRPNVVLIVADDLGVFDLGCYGRSEHRTLHLDRLASGGVQFSQGYCALPICSASRAALLTSKFPARLHLTTYLTGRADAASQRLLNAVIEPALIPSEQTLAEVLKREGYATGIFGKWHLGAGESSAENQGFEIAMEPPGNGDPATTGGKNENLITDKAIEFIRTPRNTPYFCYIPHHSPHITLRELDSQVASNAHAWNPLYASTIQSLDASIGKLLSAIEETPDAANTLVIFTSDNGGLHVPEGHPTPVTHNGPFRAGKGYMYEGGLRVPILVRWPARIAGGKKVDVPVSLLDVLPSVLQAAGVDPTRSVGPVDGESFLGLLDGTAQPGEQGDRTFFWHLPHYTNQGSRPSGAVRRGRWKLVLDYETGVSELYDLDTDIAEARDVSKERPETAADLQQAMRQWKTRVAAQECQTNPEFDAALHRTLYIDRDPSRIDGAQGTSQAIGEAWAAWRQGMNSAVAGRTSQLKNTQNAIRLLAVDANVHGKRLRYEPETYKNVLGYWTEVDDWADWEFEASKAGQYAIEIHCGCGAGNGGSEIDVVLESEDGTVQQLPWSVRETGHFQNIIIERIGTVTIPQGKVRLIVRPKTKAAAAVVDIRQVMLIPVP